MNTDAGCVRVEITPELLDAITQAAANWLDGSRDAALYRSDAEAYSRVARVSVVLALAERIRSDAERIRELERERDAMRLEEDRSGPDAGECGVSLEGAKAGAALPERVNIWSGEHRAWWREESRGYVYARRGAGVYTAQGAFQNTSHCGPEKEIVFYPAKYTAP